MRYGYLRIIVTQSTDKLQRVLGIKITYKLQIGSGFVLF